VRVFAEKWKYFEGFNGGVIMWATKYGEQIQREAPAPNCRDA
jgi:hypothetical protein